MIITRTSILDGIERTMELDITYNQMTEYNFGGKLLQDAFPNLPKEEREFIKTGITPEQWEEIFGEEDES